MNPDTARAIVELLADAPDGIDRDVAFRLDDHRTVRIEVTDLDVDSSRRTSRVLLVDLGSLDEVRIDPLAANIDMAAEELRRHYRDREKRTR